MWVRKMTCSAPEWMPPWCRNRRKSAKAGEREKAIPQSGFLGSSEPGFQVQIGAADPCGFGHGTLLAGAARAERFRGECCRAAGCDQTPATLEERAANKWPDAARYP